MKSKNQNKRTKFTAFQDDYPVELRKLLENCDPVNKDMRNGDVSRVIDFRIDSKGEVEAICENMLSIYFSAKKERRWLEMIGLDEESFEKWIVSGECRSYLKDHPTWIMLENKNASKGSMLAAHSLTTIKEFKKQIKEPTSAYLAKIVGKNQGGFIVEVQGMKAFLPGSLAAANKIVDFEDFIGKSIHVMIEDYLEKSNMFVVSYKKYLQHILPSKIEQLEINQRMVGTVTGTSKFGVFAEFEEIFTGLLHTSEMEAETLNLFKSGSFKPGDKITVWLKDVKDSKLILTEKDPQCKIEEMEKIKDNIGLVRNLKAVSVKPYGTFFEVEKGVLGLLPAKEMKKSKQKIVAGEMFNVCIDEVDVSTGKIYLSLSSDSTTQQSKSRKEAEA